MPAIAEMGRHMPTIRYWRTVGLLTLFLLVAHATPALSGNVVEVPILAAIDANDRGAFQVVLLSWDKQAAPDPLEVRWGNAQVKLKESGLGALDAAFRYAVEHTSSVRLTGTITMYGASYVPVSSDGPSAGAVMAVGFLAVLRGDPFLRGVAMTGTLQPDGRIGPVGAIPDKIRAAAREGYRTVLVPQGQMYGPHWNLHELALELNIVVKEVATVEEAYELLTGHHF